jgi:hypothetical protein
MKKGDVVEVRLEKKKRNFGLLHDFEFYVSVVTIALAHVPSAY